MMTEWEREVVCYCKSTKVVSRMAPSKDRYVVCSQGCWDRMVQDGNHERGSLMREVIRG